MIQFLFLDKMEIHGNILPTFENNFVHQDIIKTTLETITSWPTSLSKAQLEKQQGSQTTKKIDEDNFQHPYFVKILEALFQTNKETIKIAKRAKVVIKLKEFKEIHHTIRSNYLDDSSPDFSVFEAKSASENPFFVSTLVELQMGQIDKVHLDRMQDYLRKILINQNTRAYAFGIVTNLSYIIIIRSEKDKSSHDIKSGQSPPHQLNTKEGLFYLHYYLSNSNGCGYINAPTVPFLINSNQVICC